MELSCSEALKVFEEEKLRRVFGGYWQLWLKLWHARGTRSVMLSVNEIGPFLWSFADLKIPRLLGEEEEVGKSCKVTKL